MSSTSIAARLWFLTSVCFGLGAFVWGLIQDPDFEMAFAFLFFGPLAALIASVPALIILLLILKPVNNTIRTLQNKYIILVAIELLIALGYGIAAGILDTSFNYDNDPWNHFFTTTGIASGVLFAACMCAVLLSYKKLNVYFSQNISFQNKINTNMEASQEFQQNPEPQSSANKIMIKAIITGVLILAMLIPSFFVSGLVTEREQRQKEVVAEVSSKWALRQTITSPYIFIPYTVNQTGKDGKIVKVQEHLLLLPENFSVEGSIDPEERPRSIYKVLLYKSNTTNKGNFIIQIPKDIDTASLQLSEARICMGITDFKGIEEKIVVNLNGSDYDLGAGLPTNEIDSSGLSAPINLSLSDIGKSVTFSMPLKIKGSEQLHFVPLAGNSSFNIHSTWSSPSFDGNVLPGERTVTDSGFTAQWTFSKANLPFGTVLKEFNFGKENFSFGVTMIQPADQYAKTMRSVKYAILFIGLTFCLFFIIELMQKKPFHPVQYVLVGLAITIFYSLLLSISEFILFDVAYLVSAFATVMLITLYAKSHFKSWKVAMVFAAILGGLYTFIFILIRLEDTALLVGSIGLFIVLAIVMYVSRKINWYNPSIDHVQPAIV